MIASSPGSAGLDCVHSLILRDGSPAPAPQTCLITFISLILDGKKPRRFPTAFWVPQCEVDEIEKQLIFFLSGRQRFCRLIRPHCCECCFKGLLLFQGPLGSPCQRMFLFTPASSSSWEIPTLTPRREKNLTAFGGLASFSLVCVFHPY